MRVLEDEPNEPKRNYTNNNLYRNKMVNDTDTIHLYAMRFGVLNESGDLMHLTIPMRRQKVGVVPDMYEKAGLVYSDP